MVFQTGACSPDSILRVHKSSCTAVENKSLHTILINVGSELKPEISLIKPLQMKQFPYKINNRSLLADAPSAVKKDSRDIHVGPICVLGMIIIYSVRIVGGQTRIIAVNNTGKHVHLPIYYDNKPSSLSLKPKSTTIFKSKIEHIKLEAIKLCSHHIYVLSHQLFLTASYHNNVEMFKAACCPHVGVFESQGKPQINRGGWPMMRFDRTLFLGTNI